MTTTESDPTLTAAHFPGCAEQGRRAAEADWKVADCPYERGTPQHLAWIGGFSRFKAGPLAASNLNYIYVSEEDTLWLIDRLPYREAVTLEFGPGYCRLDPRICRVAQRLLMTRWLANPGLSGP